MPRCISTLEIARNLFTHFEKVGKIIHYPGLVALFALAQLADLTKDHDIIRKAYELLTAYPDRVDHPHYNFESYRVGGNGRAFLVLHGLNDEGKDLLRKYADITLAAPVDPSGIMCFPGSSHKVWIDVITAATPFMVMSGLALNEEKYIDYGIRQCFMMYDLFEDPAIHLLHQAKGFLSDPDVITQDHWGRGNGWGILGLAEIIRNLPKDDPRHMEAAVRLVRHSRALKSFQTGHGLWRQSIDCPFAWEECSGTALIAYALGVGLRYGVLEEIEFFPIFSRAVQGLADFCLNKDFSTEHTCEGCLCPGEGEQKGTLGAYLYCVQPRKDEPHSFGPLMLAMIEAYRNGILSLPWK